jgi:hypothetical protein
MAPEHFSKLLSDAIELIIFSEGGVTHSDIENMSMDELHFFIYNFKKVYTEKQEGKKEFVKSVMQFAQKAVNSIIKAITGGRQNGGL